ncbi:M14 family metallopeptidase [Halobacterium litoreum]|uniref:Succinylglutamate desuccinylase/aspartoacylase family protein n=1 Tax=Halobacterium litoreum TaxID=2039234 RepID=A0ABD5ND03_9EURY|nr:succinylglutamate desuccinylase/aspartoacylase family protein [Halobacterium litoreum]UHH13897.1 succinylglutamate desuccinylase/aspartoacylase family protein [Halobacterium litoreum]
MFGDDVHIDTTVLGDGDPDLAVVGGVHGDEPSGPRAIQHVLDRDPELQRPVKFVLANPAAAVAHRRYLDADMNRVFPGDPGSEDRERRLAAELKAELADCLTLSIHSTHSSVEPLAFVSGSNPDAQAVASQLPVSNVVNHDPAVDGAFTSCEGVVTVEAGRQLTENATTNATKMVRAFLRLTDALPEEPPESDPDFYTAESVAEKPEEEDAQLLAQNFERVEAGETYAETTDEEFVADESFYPILMSETGYDDIFGYRGAFVGEAVEEARAAWGTPPQDGE